MKIKTDLRKRVEALAYQCRPEETGGYFLKNSRGVITDFLPIPNIHPTPKQAYQPLNKAKELANRLARSKSNGYSWNVEAFFHTHPEPCIMSAADLSYADYNRDMIFVTITPIDNLWNKKYIWYACKGIAPERIEFV